MVHFFPIILHYIKLSIIYWAFKHWYIQLYACIRYCLVEYYAQQSGEVHTLKSFGTALNFNAVLKQCKGNVGTMQGQCKDHVRTIYKQRKLVRNKDHAFTSYKQTLAHRLHILICILLMIVCSRIVPETHQQE